MACNVQPCRSSAGGVRLLGVALLAVAALAPSPSRAAITFGQIDTFEAENGQAGTLGWSHGSQFDQNPPTNQPDGGPLGAGDQYLRNVSTGLGGAGSKPVVLNEAQWIGNFTAAGVTRVEARMANFGATDLTMRVGVEGGPTFTRYVSTNATAVSLPAGSGWRPVAFDINTTTMANASFGGSSPLADVLADVRSFRFVSATTAVWQGDSTASTLGIDNIRALRLPGDANFSGAVNTDDFLALASNFGRSGRSWNQGDFDFNETVNSSDFVILAQNFGKVSPASAGDWATLGAFGAGIGVNVPEPSGAGLVLGGMMLVTSGRRRKPVR